MMMMMIIIILQILILLFYSYQVVSDKSASTSCRESLTCSLSCTYGTMTVTSAFYGAGYQSGYWSWDEYGSYTWIDASCGADITTSSAFSNCNGYESCSVTASNSIFGDTCGGNLKYLHVTYSCPNDPCSSSGRDYSNNCNLCGRGYLY